MKLEDIRMSEPFYENVKLNFKILYRNQEKLLEAIKLIAPKPVKRVICDHVGKGDCTSEEKEDCYP